MRDHDVTRNKHNDTHESIDEVLHQGAAVLPATQTRNGEKHGNPNEGLVVGEHPKYAEHQGDYTADIGLLGGRMF